MNEHSYHKSEEYREGYLAGEEERIALATECDRLRHVLAKASDYGQGYEDGYKAATQDLSQNRSV